MTVESTGDVEDLSGVATPARRPIPPAASGLMSAPRPAGPPARRRGRRRNGAGPPPHRWGGGPVVRLRGVVPAGVAGTARLVAGVGGYAIVTSMLLALLAAIGSVDSRS